MTGFRGKSETPKPMPDPPEAYPPNFQTPPPSPEVLAHPRVSHVRHLLASGLESVRALLAHRGGAVNVVTCDANFKPTACAEAVLSLAPMLAAGAVAVVSDNTPSRNPLGPHLADPLVDPPYPQNEASTFPMERGSEGRLRRAAPGIRSRGFETLGRDRRFGVAQAS